MSRPFDLLVAADPPSKAVGAVVAVVTVGLCTVVIYPLGHLAPVVSLGVVYLVAVLVVSAAWGLWMGVGTSLLSAASFNFFHLSPAGRFTIYDSSNWVALVAFLVAAVLASSVAEVTRARTGEAEARRRDADLAAQQARSLLAEREALAEEVVEAEALRRADVVKTAILRAVSHDLRSPLTAISAAGEAVALPGLQEDEREDLAAVIGHETRRLSRLVENLLDVSRLQSGYAEPRREWMAVEEVIGAALVDIGAAPGEFALSIDADLPPVRADAAQMERALVNVLENARRHSGGHPVSLRARAVASIRSGRGRLLVRVVDRGPGIAASQVERVFEPFYRMGDAGEAHHGSGLGLAIARGFTEANGGSIHVESLPGQGATFVFELPLSEPQPQTESRPLHQSPREGGSGEPRRAAQPGGDRSRERVALRRDDER